MLTFLQAESERDERAAYRPYRVVVAGVERLSPSFVRVTFAGEQLAYFATHGLDQRVKIVFPVGGGLPDLGVDDEETVLAGGWYGLWRALPDAERAPFRTYTVRAIRPAEREIDVDFVSHGDGGPAARWLSGAALGDEVVIVGPDSRSLGSAIGIDWHPGSAREMLLVGDETAAPAICGILASLPAAARARAFVEVPDAADVIDPDARITWLARGSSVSLESAVRDWAAREPEAFAPVVAAQHQELAEVDVDVDLLWESPEESRGEFYAWIAGESAMVKSLRRFLVSELGIDRTRVAFMGYWRHGKSEAQG